MKINKLFICLIGCVIAVSSCGGNNHGTTDHHEEAEEAGHHHHGEEGIIKFTAQQAEAAGLTTEVVTPGQFSSVIKTGGEILPAVGNVSTVVATVPGVVCFNSAMVTGHRVSKGDALASVSSRDLADGDQAVKAKAAYEAAEKAYQRAETLVKDQIISQREYEQYKVAYIDAKASYEAYRGAQGSLVAPISGYISRVDVNDGDYVEVGQAVAVVSQNNRLQLRADLPEKYFGQLRNVRSAHFRPVWTDKVYRLEDMGGKLLAAGTVADGCYVPVNFSFDNTEGLLSGTYADVYLVLGGRDRVMTVPESALVEDQGTYYVFIQVHEDEYRKQEVRIGEGDGIRREIISGLKDGDEVVATGAVQVKLASVSVVPEGHTHNH